MVVKFRILLITLFALCCSCLYANGEVACDTIRMRILFRQDLSTLDLDYMGNRMSLKGFAEKLSRLEQNPHVSIKNVQINSSSSPEGEYLRNKDLSKRRAERVKTLLFQYAPNLKTPVKIKSQVHDWQLLTELVKKSEVPYRDEVLRILTKSDEYDKKPRLLTLRDGIPWKYMYKHLFPEMRNGEVLICDYTVYFQAPDSLKIAGSLADNCTAIVLPKDTSSSVGADFSCQIPNIPLNLMGHILPPSEMKVCYFGIKSNLLADLLLIPNIGVEIPLSKKWSMSANWAYGWWSDREEYFVHAYGGEVGLRRWFGARKSEANLLTGAHLGVYGQMYTYDIKLSENGMWGEPWSWGAGIDFGYSFGLTSNLNLDIAAGVGYFTGMYKDYWRDGVCDVWQATSRRRWIGPTKLEASLVWVPKFIKQKKGGVR